MGDRRGSEENCWRVCTLYVHCTVYRMYEEWLAHTTSYSFYSTLQGERRKTMPPCPFPMGFKKSIQKPQVWELSRLCPETSTKLYVHEFGFCSRAQPHNKGIHPVLNTCTRALLFCCAELCLTERDSVTRFASSGFFSLIIFPKLRMISKAPLHISDCLHLKANT